MAAGQRASVSISDLAKLTEQNNRPAPLTTDEVHDYAVAALVVTRGLSRADKLRVHRKMRRLIG